MSIDNSNIAEDVKVLMLKGEKGETGYPTQEQVNEALSEMGDTLVNPWMDANADVPIDAWLDDHPEATTTVQDDSLTTAKYKDKSVTTSKLDDESVTEDKLNDDIAKVYHAGKFVDNLELDDIGFLTMYDSGYTSLQGICVVDDQYLVVCRYSGDNRILQVYDVINKTLVKNNEFTDSQIGHVNSLTYDDGYVYLATLNATYDIVKLQFDSEDGTLTYDSVVYSHGIQAKNIAVYNGEFWMAGRRTTGSAYRFYKTTDFETVELAFETDFSNSVGELDEQGLAVNEEYVFIPFSQYPPDTNTPTLERMEEKIMVCKHDGTLVKVLSYPRVSYGEIEDVDIIILNDQPYLFIGTNQNDEHVSCVWTSRLFTFTKNNPILKKPKFKGKYNSTRFYIWVDSENGTPFADGNQTNPFKDLPSALLFARNTGVACSLILLGTFSDTITIRSMPAPMEVNLSANTKIKELSIRECSQIYINASDTSELAHLYVDHSSVFSRGLLPFTKGDNNYTEAMAINRSTVIIQAGAITGYSRVATLNTAILNCQYASTDATTVVVKVAGYSSLACLNNKLYGITLA